MPNRNYINGRAREYKIMKELVDSGYVLVMRTAGSHSPVDVIGIYDMFLDPKEGLCFRGKLIQAKVSKKYKDVHKFDTTVETPNGSILVERWEFPSRPRDEKGVRLGKHKPKAK